MIAQALILACAPHVAPVTIQEIVRVESGGDANVIHVVGETAPRHFTASVDGIAAAKAAVAQGKNVAIGLMQVTTRTGALYGYSIEQLFDPCTNLRAGAAILADSYGKAAAMQGEGQGALQAALSAYNTGNFTAGFSNGYVALYYGGHARAPAEMTASPYNAGSTVYLRTTSTEPTAPTTPAASAAPQETTDDRSKHHDNTPHPDNRPGGTDDAGRASGNHTG